MNWAHQRGRLRLPLLSTTAEEQARGIRALFLARRGYERHSTLRDVSMRSHALRQHGTVAGLICSIGVSHPDKSYRNRANTRTETVQKPYWQHVRVFVRFVPVIFGRASTLFDVRAHTAVNGPGMRKKHRGGLAMPTHACLIDVSVTAGYHDLRLVNRLGVLRRDQEHVRQRTPGASRCCMRQRTVRILLRTPLARAYRTQRVLGISGRMANIRSRGCCRQSSIQKPSQVCRPW